MTRKLIGKRGTWKTGEEREGERKKNREGVGTKYFTYISLAFQKIFCFAGESYEFMDWFNGLIKFFNTFTTKLSEMEKLHLVDDPSKCKCN